MLFNSYEFLFLYLPIVFLGFFVVASRSHRLAAFWLVVASLVFYGWWNPKFVSLLLASVVFNYATGLLIARVRAKRYAKVVLAIGIAGDLGVLAFFKYTNFFLATINHLVGTDIPLLGIVLPLGISFFTFTQIAFLVDVYRGIAEEYNFTHYALFVTYFPHLIAGPVLHHKQMMPQFADTSIYRMSAESIATGLTGLTIGLVKKVLIADTFGEYAGPVFASAREGHELHFFVAWSGALAYTLQLYFDFSGYTDMALGLSRLLGVRLPINFNSPYKSVNIVEFWRRWHMTLSQFLRDYLYIPLGGNRRGPVRRYLNLMLTMLLGGLWHGASWTFVAWGGLHGLYLVLNHGWQAFRRHVGWTPMEPAGMNRVVATGLTFIAVVVAWVFFRAETFSAAGIVLRGMTGLSGVSLPASLGELGRRLDGDLSRSITYDGVFSGSPQLEALGSGRFFIYLVMGLGIVWWFPNTQEFLARDNTVDKSSLSVLRWSPNRSWALVMGLLLAASVVMMQRVSEFLYFQF